ncbi:MAG TPA: hypothetical protein VF669_23930 [Tepidisphaeraceae bacterium]|jgi:hypothetical protein
MGLLPTTNNGKIEFFEAHNAPWSANATAIGTTTGAVTALATKTATARAKLLAQTQAQEAAKTATAELQAAVRDMVTAGMAIVGDVRHKADVSGESVYFLAQIPAPATPAPVPPPGTPSNFVATLTPDGALKLNWKCTNPANATGTTYQVFRKLGSQSTFNFIGSTGLKTLTDDTLPGGNSSVTYRIIAVRSTAQGTPGQFVVNFGSTGGSNGAMMATVESAPKLAA